MGINGLKNIIKKYSSTAFREIKINELSGNTIAIDSSILLYKFRYLYQDNYLYGFNKLIDDYQFYNIKLIFVFEGKTPDAKKKTIAKRVEIRNKQTEKIKRILSESMEREEYIDDSELMEYPELPETIKEKIEKLRKNIIIVNSEHSNEVIKLLLRRGIEYFRAPGEAEEYCAFLSNNSIVDYVLTEDTDSLTFGAKKVLFNNKGVNYLLCELDIVLKELNLSQNEFIDFCILCGCDYLPGIPKIGPVNSLKIIQKHKTIDSFIQENDKTKKYIIPESFNYSLARELFKQNKEYQLIHENPIINENTENIPLFIN
jgi:flap endonuclease-1